jgi:hypothetical protein
VRHTWPGFVEDENKSHSYSLTPSNNIMYVLQSGWCRSRLVWKLATSIDEYYEYVVVMIT